MRDVFYGVIWLIRESFRRQDRILAHIVDVGEIHDRVAVGRDRDRSHGHVDLAELQRIQQAVECHVPELDLDAELPGDLLHQRDVESVHLEIGIVELEGRVVRRGANYDLACGLDALPVARSWSGLGGGACCGWKPVAAVRWGGCHHRNRDSDHRGHEKQGQKGTLRLRHQVPPCIV